MEYKAQKHVIDIKDIDNNMISALPSYEDTMGYALGGRLNKVHAYFICIKKGLNNFNYLKEEVSLKYSIKEDTKDIASINYSLPLYENSYKATLYYDKDEHNYSPLIIV